MLYMLYVRFLFFNIMYVYIYIYDYMYACVCVCQYLMSNSLALFVDHSAVFSAFNVFRMSLVLVVH